MRVGFTGTQRGLTPEQAESLSAVISILMDTPDEFHHGDCMGADAEAHEIADDVALKIIVHPPINDVKRAFCEEGTSPAETLVAKPYIDRNHDIVDATDVLVACPRGPEIVHSGTWATVRYAKRHDKPVIIVWPDGAAHVESLTQLSGVIMDLVVRGYAS